MHYAAKVKNLFSFCFLFNCFLVSFPFFPRTDLTLSLQTMTLMLASIQRYKFYEHVQAGHLSRLAQAKNELKTL